MNDRDAYLSTALQRAVGALQRMSERDIQIASELDSTFILNACADVYDLSSIRTRIARSLEKRLNASWIKHGDMCEVFAVLGGLWRYDPRCVTGEYLTWAVRRLVTSEVAVGGPYYSNNTVAIHANIQVALFARLVAKRLPNLEAFIDDFVAARRFYNATLTSFGLLHLLAKVCDNSALTTYVDRHWRQKRWRTPLHKMIALSILKDKIPTRVFTDELLAVCEEQLPNGLWAGEPLTRHPRAAQTATFVTTSLLIEILKPYRQCSASASTATSQLDHHATEMATKRLFKACAEPLHSSVLGAIGQICGADRGFEVTGLPRMFARSLKTPPVLTNRQYCMLGSANTCSWIAYTIYDDFLDAEGVPAQLPVANLAMRTALDCFRAVLRNREFQEYISRVFRKMDEANAWEVTFCRFSVKDNALTILQLPRYDTTLLAERSFAHGLAALATLGCHYPPQSQQFRYIELAFRQYLIARQLNDDMHDWEKDIQAGQASYVVVAIMRDMHLQPDTYRLPALLPRMRRYFRQTTMRKMCQRSLRHIGISRRAFTKSQLLTSANDIYDVLDELDSSVRHSLDIHTKVQALVDMGVVGF